MTKSKRVFVTIVVFINVYDEDDEEVLIKSLDPTLVDEKDMNCGNRTSAKRSL